MAAPNAQGAKICEICHRDCSDRPRTKDEQGRYFCRECAERAKQAHRLQQSGSSDLGSTPPVAPPPPAPEADDDFQINVDDIRTAPPPRPKPQVVVEEPEVEEVRVSLSDAAPLVRHVLGGMPEFFSQPWVSFAVPTIVFLVLYSAARQDANAAQAFGFLALMYCASIELLIRVLAFCESIGTGFLTLCLPFFELYFVYWINENRYIKALYTASLLVTALLYALGIEQLLHMLPKHP